LPIRNTINSLVPSKFSITNVTAAEKEEIRRTNPSKFVLAREIGSFKVNKIMVPLFAEDEGKKTEQVLHESDVTRLKPFRAQQNPHLKYTRRTTNMDTYKYRVIN